MNIQKSTGILLVLLLARVGPLWAQADSGQPFSILDCIEYANGHQTDVQLATYDEEIGEQQIREARGRGLPQANVNASYEDKVKVPKLVIPGYGELTSGYQYNTAISGEVTQMLYDPTFPVAMKAAKTTRQLYSQQTLQAKEQTAYQVATSYYQVIVAKEQLRLLEANLSSTSETLKNTELQFENGLSKAVDVNRLKVNVSNLQSRILQAEQSLEQSLNQLKFDIGMPIQDKLLIESINIEATPIVLQEADLNQMSEKGRLDYQIMQTNHHLQILNSKNEHSGYFPTLTAFANYGYTAQGPSFGILPTGNEDWVDYSNASIGIRLKIPVFDGLQRSARVQKSIIEEVKLEKQLTQQKERMKMEVINAESKYKNVLERIESDEQNVNLAKEVLRVSQLEFSEGVSTSSEVISAESSLTEAQNTYINTLLDLYTVRLDLEKAKGSLMDYILLNN